MSYVLLYGNIVMRYSHSPLPMRKSLIVLLFAIAVGRPARAQLRLGDALRRADTAGIANRAAAGVAAERDGIRLAPMRGILPAVRVEASAIRTTDPIGAFGTVLRQRRISATDFNPATLNYPAAVSNVGTGLVAEIPLFNADAWLGRDAAGRAADAGHAAADWTRYSTRTDVIRAWFGALTALEKVTAYQAAVRSGAAHVKQAESLQRNGIVTPSDALMASVKAGEIEAELASARGDVLNAQRGLDVLLGGNGSTPTVPAGALPTAQQLRAFAAADTTVIAAPRADVLAASMGAAAARRDADRARATLLPRLNGFARYDWNDPSRVYGGDKNWTVGVIASWAPFTGASEIAEQRATQGRAAQASAYADGANAQARFESERANTDLRVALLRLAIAERSVTQAVDAHRIVNRRYEGGLASVTELLDASATETHVATMFAKARYDVVVALAARRLALGLDPAALAALDTTDSRIQPSKDTDR
jgi:outer membrane protein